MVWLKQFYLIAVVSLFVACTSGANPAEANKVKFESAKIKVGNVSLEVELAKSFEQQQHGLMYRTKLGDHEGMLFVFIDEDYRSFWMKNTYIDLSIGYFNKDRELKEIIDMKATTMMDTHHPTYPSRVKAQYALEVPKGWFQKNKVKVGDKFNWD